MCRSNPNDNSICSFCDKKYEEKFFTVLFICLMFPLFFIRPFCFFQVALLTSSHDAVSCFSSTFTYNSNVVIYSIEYNIVEGSSKFKHKLSYCCFHLSLCLMFILQFCSHQQFHIFSIFAITILAFLINNLTFATAEILLLLLHMLPLNMNKYIGSGIQIHNEQYHYMLKSVICDGINIYR